MRLYVEGHSVRHGYIVSVEYSVAEIREQIQAGVMGQVNDQICRLIPSRDQAFALVARFNRRFATHERRSA